MVEFLLAFLSSLLAGVINAIAGGGTLITFPSLVWLGLDPIVANITNTVALWTGSFFGAIGFRGKFKGIKHLILPFLIASTFGALLGALILIITPSQTFKSLVPFLILFAVLVLALSEPIKRLSLRFSQIYVHPFIPLFLQFLTGVYGGYFGAGIGIIMLASISLSGISHIHTANALKNLLGFSINFVGAIVFLISGKISWLHALVMMPGFALGGYLGAKLSQRLRPSKIKAFIIAWGLFLAFYMLLLK